MDLVVRCSRLPRPGETLLAESSAEICGGKGANQAVAAARAGGDVRMIGRVGDDAFAKRLVTNLEEEGIDCSAVHSASNCASGLAIVAVESSGQNSILVVPGSNARVVQEDVTSAQAMIESSDVLLVQLEVPLETVVAAVDVARHAGVRVILDPAPAVASFPDRLFDVDLICPNETETEALIGTPVATVEDAEAAARQLADRGCRQVAITLGDRGTMLLDQTGKTDHVAAIPVEAIDTTAAGDAFAGALAVFWAEGCPLLEAVRMANRAGAIAASREGAQPAMASRAEIQSHT